MIDPPAIRTHELAKRYGSITALAGLSMTIPRGDIFGFLGPNGAGKRRRSSCYLADAADVGWPRSLARRSATVTPSAAWGS